MELLLDSGADLGTRNGSKETAFDLAQKNRKRNVMTFLAGDICTLGTRSSIILEAGLQKNLPKIEEAVEPQPDVGESSDGRSLLSASRSGHLDIIQRILSDGSDVNERDKRLRTLLDAASKQGGLEIARTVIDYGADVDSRDDSGLTPLHTAARHGHIDVVRLLLDNGADKNASQRRGYTSLHLASASGHYEIVELLLERGANVQLRDTYGKIPYQRALVYGQQAIAQLLLEYFFH